MDATQIILLTSLFNIIISGLVGGVVIYVIQKKIDATIQKSLFEHQTRFARSYPKTMEVLEAYHLKLQDCSRFSKQFHLQIERVLNGEPTLDAMEVTKKRHEFMEAIAGLQRDFQNNRLHIPDELILELEQIRDRASVLVLASLDLSGLANEPTEVLLKEVDFWSKITHIPTKFSLELDENIPKKLKEEYSRKFEEAIPKKNTVAIFTSRIDEEFSNLSQRIEKLYKSVAEAQ